MTLAAEPAVLRLGLTDYKEAWDLQRRLVDERLRGLRPDTLLLLEHPEVVTRGRGYNGRTMAGTTLPVYDIERGGDVTYHGPGQLVGYPIVHLKEKGLTVGRYIRILEQALIDAVLPLGVRAERLRSFTGVWAGGKKIASIGIAVKSWVTYHGFALNVSTDLRQFAGIYPCGLQPEQMASLESILGREVSMPEAAAAVEAALHKTLSLR